MKKIVSLVLITVICCTFLFACKNAEDTGELYLIKNTLTEKSGTTTTEFLYNEDYQIVKQKTTAGGISNTDSDLGYDENGYQNYQKNVSKSGLVSEIFIKNDANGRWLEMKIVQTYNGKKTETITTYEYTDENGSRTETSTSGTVTTVTNDEYGNAITRSNNRGQSTTYENKYEGEFLIETKNTMTVGTNTIVTITKYEYDSQGNKVKETSYDSSGNVISTLTYEYSSKVKFVE